MAMDIPEATPSNRDKAIQAFLELLSERRFEDVGLAEVAGRAGLKLSQLRAEFGSTLAIYAAFVKAVDEAVLDESGDMGEEPHRDRLFDVMMRRLEELTPHKEAVRSMLMSARRNPGLALAMNGVAVRSQKWMLEAAGISTSGPRGALRAQGAALLFARVVGVWLDDEEEGLNRTMAALDRGLATIRRNYQSAVDRGRMTADELERRMARYTPTLDFNALADCDLVIEAVFELMDIKKDVLRRLDATAKPGAILATNTSYLNVDEIAAETKRPEWVVGMHFFSPANIMRLLEVVRGDKSAPDTIATAMDLAKKIRKVAVLAGVTPGFIGNRMLVPRQVQAEKLLLEGAMPWQVDKVWYDLGMPMGPFAMYDLAGLDLGWNKDASAGRDSRELLNEAGRHGQKTKAGYYDYDDNRKSTPSPVTQKIIEDYRARQGITAREIGDEEILERTLYPLINEGAKILEEGKASRASDIDVVWVNGYGFPPYLGGPMYYAGVIGLKKIVAKLEEIGVEPSALLRKLADEGKTFADAK